MLKWVIKLMFRAGIHFKLRDETDTSCLPEIQVGHSQAFSSQFLQWFRSLQQNTSCSCTCSLSTSPVDAVTNHYNLTFLSSYITVSHSQLQHKITTKPQATPARHLSRLPTDFLFSTYFPGPIPKSQCYHWNRTPATTFPQPSLHLLWIPQTTYSYPNFSNLSLCPRPKLSANLTIVVPKATSRLKADPHHSLWENSQVSSPSSVVGNLLWFLFPLKPHP